MKSDTTIAAIATPPGQGGVGIVRISGPEALQVGLRIFVPSQSVSAFTPRHFYYGSVFSPSGACIDTGLFVYMQGPASFTGEDIVELQCHGGSVVLKAVLESVLKSGAVIASPGEFTKRAFLNDKMDLIQAQAVIEVISSQTESALGAAGERLRGALSKEVSGIKEALVALVAHIEAELDFSEDEIDPMPEDELIAGLGRIHLKIQRLLSTYEQGRAIRDGVRVLILGRPNVGKSSLLNLLLKEDRAIVAHEPGTTRDLIEETLNINGVPVRLMDTAGLRDGAGHVEAIGIGLARGRIKDADLILFVIDSSSETFQEDLSLLNETSDKKTMIVANKCDMLGNIEESRSAIETIFQGHAVVFISALDGSGIEGLNNAIYSSVVGSGALGAQEGTHSVLIASLRHKESLEDASLSIVRAMASASAGSPREFIAIDIRSALERLGEITGEVTTEDILDRIFSGFCIGK